MPIYTKKGDKGETGLLFKKDGKSVRVSKDYQRIKTIGAIDEANTFIGVAKAFCKSKEIVKNLEVVQRNLFRIGSILAGSNLRFSIIQITHLEKQIDEMDKRLPKLANFILPGGTCGGSFLQQSRSVARRAERELSTLNKIESVAENIQMYMNRLSDYLFMLARMENFENNTPEIIWKP